MKYNIAESEFSNLYLHERIRTPQEKRLIKYKLQYAEEKKENTIDFFNSPC